MSNPKFSKPVTIQTELQEFYVALVAMRNKMIPYLDSSSDRLAELARRVQDDIERLKDSVDLMENELR